MQNGAAERCKILAGKKPDDSDIKLKDDPRGGKIVKCLKLKKRDKQIMRKLFLR